MTDSTGTYLRTVAVDAPDLGAQTITFELKSSVAVASNNEIFPITKTYTLTLDADGLGSIQLPCPDNTGTLAWLWIVDINNHQYFTLSYDAASITLGELLTAAVSTETPNSVANLLASKANKVSGGTEDNFVSLDADGDIQDSGSAASDFDAAGTAASAVATHEAADPAHDDGTISAAASASNYTPIEATVEGHLAGIDTALGSVGGGGGGVTEIWIPAMAMDGSAQDAFSTSNRPPVCFFDDSASEQQYLTHYVPSGWTTWNVTFYWLTTHGNSGNVYWRFRHGSGADTESATSYSNEDVLDSAPASANTVKTTQVVTGGTPPVTGDVVRMGAVRAGADASDTMTGDAGLIGILLEKAS